MVLFGGLIICISTICPTRSLMRGPGTVPLKVQKSYVTPSASCPNFSSVTSVTTTLPDGEGADGISVGDLLRFGAYAGPFASPKALSVKNGIVKREIVSSNMINETLGICRLVAARNPLTLPAHILLTRRGAVAGME